LEVSELRPEGLQGIASELTAVVGELTAGARCASADGLASAAPDVAAAISGLMRSEQAVVARLAHEANRCARELEDRAAAVTVADRFGP
jgi:hypothetical protein